MDRQHLCNRVRGNGDAGAVCKEGMTDVHVFVLKPLCSFEVGFRGPWGYCRLTGAPGGPLGGLGSIFKEKTLFWSHVGSRWGRSVECMLFWRWFWKSLCRPPCAYLPSTCNLATLHSKCGRQLVMLSYDFFISPSFYSCMCSFSIRGSVCRCKFVLTMQKRGSLYTFLFGIIAVIFSTFYSGCTQSLIWGHMEVSWKRTLVILCGFICTFESPRFGHIGNSC